MCVRERERLLFSILVYYCVILSGNEVSERIRILGSEVKFGINGGMRVFWIVNYVCFGV